MFVSDEADGAAIDIRVYDDATDRAQVIALWNAVFSYTSPHNLPEVSIDLKLRADDGLFFVAVRGDQVVGTVLSGYDGHRGWLYSVAVAPAARHRGLGTRLVRHAEQALAARGCPKINLQILESNAGVVAFYERLGYAVEPRICMGRRLPAGSE
jgi:ribosomal protein S18 acetylase RimI-like enzyme